MQLKILILLPVILFGIFNCKKDNNSIPNPQLSDSEYVLPYPIGKKYLCSQSFGGNISHQGVFTFVRILQAFLRKIPAFINLFHFRLFDVVSLWSIKNKIIMKKLYLLNFK